MNEEMKKSLTDLIDETLLELEELKKSRMSASEIKLEGPGEGIAGKPSDGDLHAKAEEEKKKDEEDKKKKEEEAKKAEGKNEEAAKAEGKNEEAAKAEKDEPKDKEKKEPKDEEKKDKDEKKEEKPPFMKKSESPEEIEKLLNDGLKKSKEEFDGLMKSYVDEKVKPLEDKLSTILDLVNKIADQPVTPKGLTGRTVPLMKSADDAGEPLSKSEVASKLFELKKSGAKVDSLDITRAEMGQDLNKLLDNY